MKRNEKCIKTQVMKESAVSSDLQQKGKGRIQAERKYKDTVFRMLFNDRDRLLSLYNAINGGDDIYEYI